MMGPHFTLPCMVSKTEKHCPFGILQYCAVTPNVSVEGGKGVQLMWNVIHIFGWKTLSKLVQYWLVIHDCGSKSSSEPTYNAQTDVGRILVHPLSVLPEITVHKVGNF